jgi:hypothetical protein
MVLTKCVNNANRCGSGLARDGVSPDNRDYLERNRIPSSNPRNVSGNIWSSIKSRTMLVDEV